MLESDLVNQIAAWMETNVMVSTALATIGAAALLIAALVAFFFGVKGIASFFGSGGASTRTIRRAGQEPGYRVLLGEFDGGQSSASRDIIEQSLEDHLAEFSFGAQFRTFRVKGVRGRPEGAALDGARRRLKKTGADMIVWGARQGDGEEALRIYGVSRGGSRLPSQAHVFTLRIPGKLRIYSEPMRRVVAYLLAKRLQPALGRPEAFRAEKIAELGATLDTLLDVFEAEDGPALPAGAQREVETDFSGITLHLTESGPRPEWIDKLIERRRATLEELKDVPDAEAQIDARLDLGQALLKRSETAFDPVGVREASVHLNAAIDALRQHDTIRKAQRASDGLQRAKSLVETRRRFAVNFSA
ncbi:MAG: hypothetical protein AAF216_00515 [Pseudomonadota bacterium]